LTHDLGRVGSSFFQFLVCWVGLGWIGSGWVEIFSVFGRLGWVGSTIAKVLKF